MRIHITGNAGSGKTTLAKELGDFLKLDVYGLDKIVWMQNWKKTPSDKRKQLEQGLVDKSQWVIEGVSSIVRQSSDVIIFLDYPRYICLIRCIKRNWKYLFTSRPELPNNCPEIKIIPQLLKMIWQFPKVAKPFIVKDLDGKHFVTVTNANELNDLINEIRHNKRLWRQPPQ
ncbi:MAG: hypothetical protein OEY06_05365 [Gammaproteobacteria bacterium]|nr:hypothetical protein [Gammaproteobacteria bacterium]